MSMACVGEMIMFFSKAGLIIAWLVFVPGAACFAIVTIGVWTGNIAAVAEVFGNRFVASSGTFVQFIGIGVAFGIAAEISRAIAARP